MLVFLVGYMGCGKSTIARKLSTRIGWEWADTDHMIEDQMGMSVGEIFENMGEESFRAMERDVVLGLVERGDNLVISTGGGLPLWGNNMELMDRAGLTVYLCRSAQNIASRLSPAGRAKRPKIKDLSDDELVEYMSRNILERDLTYRQARMVIEATKLSDRSILNIIEERINR